MIVKLYHLNVDEQSHRTDLDNHKMCPVVVESNYWFRAMSCFRNLQFGVVRSYAETKKIGSILDTPIIVLFSVSTNPWESQNFKKCEIYRILHRAVDLYRHEFRVIRAEQANDL